MWGWRSHFAFNVTNTNRSFFLFKRTLTNGKWNILFFGTDNFSLSSLKRVHSEFVNGSVINKLEVVSTLNSPLNAVARFCNKNSLIVHPWERLPVIENSFHLGIVVSFGHLIPKDVIQSFPLGILNVHASLLPRWRGAAPIIHCLINGDTQTGISIMKIKPHRFDIGDVIYQKKIDINADILQPELHKVLSDIGSKALIECIHDLPNCLDRASPQDNLNATLAPKITQSLSKIKWEEQSAKQIYDLSRGLSGVYPLETEFDNRHVKLKQVYLYGGSDEGIVYPPGHFRFNKHKKIVRVWCRDKCSIYFKRIKVEGKSEMSALDFKNGFMKNVHDEFLYFESID